MSVVRFYSTPPISTDALQARIRVDATLSEPVRRRALEFARRVPLVVLDQWSARSNGALVEYDQWHPESGYQGHPPLAPAIERQGSPDRNPAPSR